MEKLWTRVSDMAGVPSVIGGRLLAELGRISSVMKQAVGAYERRGPGGIQFQPGSPGQCVRRYLSAVETHVSLVGHKDLPARSTGSCARRAALFPGHDDELRGRLDAMHARPACRPRRERGGAADGPARPTANPSNEEGPAAYRA